MKHRIIGKRSSYGIFFVLALIIIFGVALMIYRIATQGFGAGMQDFGFKVSDHCMLHRNSAHEIFILCDGIEKEIDAKVQEVGWNSEYLVATTNPLSKSDNSNPNHIYMVPDAGVKYWWVIHFSKKTNSGPLTYENYLALKNELKIQDLEFQMVEDLKHKNQ